MPAAAPGPLLATGRDADVYDLGDGRVLRRYRDDRGGNRDTTREAAVMTHLAAHGYPVPTVHAAQGADLVMDRIDGPTMLARLTAKPWQLRRQARTLARLQRDLAAVPVDGPVVDPHVGPGGVMVHGDLHPENVIVTDTGPIVIDWTNTALGPPGTDTAVVWALLHAAELPTAGVIDRFLDTIGRRLLLRFFLAASDVEAARRALPTVVAHRQADPNLSEAEKAKMVDLLRSG